MRSPGDEFVMGDHHLSLLVLTDPFPRYDRTEVDRPAEDSE